jgi:hypothetical protein
LARGVELVLLEHIEEVWQRIPLALITIGCLVLFVVSSNQTPSKSARCS